VADCFRAPFFPRSAISCGVWFFSVFFFFFNSVARKSKTEKASPSKPATIKKKKKTEKDHTPHEMVLRGTKGAKQSATEINKIYQDITKKSKNHRLTALERTALEGAAYAARKSK